MTRILAVLIAALLAGHASAQYVESGGYWWKGGIPYTRSIVSQKYALGGGCYSYQNVYSYSPVQTYTLPSPTDADWKNKLLDIAAKKDDFQNYLQAVRALGLDQPTAQSSHYSYQQAQAGSTVYGTTTYNQIAEAYGSVDPMVLFQQQSRLTQNAQDAGREANQLFSARLEQVGNAQAKVAEILARGEVAKQLLKAAEPTGAKFTQSVTVTNSGGSTTTTLPPLPQPQASSLQQVIATRCLACHSGGRLEKSKDSTLFPAGCDMSRYAEFSREQKWRTIELVVAGSMPKDGQALSAAETGLFYADWYGTNPGGPQPIPPANVPPLPAAPVKD